MFTLSAGLFVVDDEEEVIESFDFVSAVVVNVEG